MSKASKQLSDIARKLRATEVARTIGVSDTAVRFHCSGERSPNNAIRAKYFQHYGIALDDWDAPAELPVTPTAKVAAVTTRAEGTTARAELEGALAELDRLGGESADWAPRDRIALATARASVADRFGKLAGEQATDETKLLASPKWLAIRAAVAKALLPFPDASTAVVAALRALGVA